MGWSTSADPRRRQFEVKKGENDALKREIMDIENKRVEEHRDLTSDVSIKIITIIIVQSDTWNSRSVLDLAFELSWDICFHLMFILPRSD